MRSLAFALLLLPAFAYCQQGKFPEDWIGHWKGELLWYSGNDNTPKKVNMELHILRSDTVGKYTWQIVYGDITADNRPYLLIPKDTASGHWAIDELNGIVLDQYWVAGRLSGAFSVQKSSILNNYWLEGGKLHVEFYNTSVKPVAVTGKGTQDSPIVNSFQVKSFQKAVLTRTQ